MGNILQMLQGLGGGTPGMPPAAMGGGGQTPFPVIMPQQGGGIPRATLPPQPSGAETSNRKFTVPEIQGLYNEFNPEKTVDVSRIMKPLGEGPFSLDQLRGLDLNASGMSGNRSLLDWGRVLKSLERAPATGPLTGQSTAPAPWTPSPGTLTAPWASLLNSDPIMGMMMVNALGGGQIGQQGLGQMLGKGGQQQPNPMQQLGTFPGMVR